MCLGVPLVSIILTLIKPNLPLGLEYLCLLSIPFTSVVINVFTRHPGNTLSLWMLLSVRTDPTFPLAIFRGECE